MKQPIYITKISDRRWIAYDVPGNLGWIMYVTVTIISLAREPLSAYGILSAIPAVLMVIGVMELIRERIVKLDRELPLLALAYGFGALTLGGLLGFFCGVGGMIAGFSVPDLLATAGGLLCFVFAGLLLAGYRRKG